MRSKDLGLDKLAKALDAQRREEHDATLQVCLGSSMCHSILAHSGNAHFQAEDLVHVSAAPHFAHTPAG